MKRGMTDGAAAIGRIPGRLAKIRMQLRTIMIAICELALAMFVIRLVVFLYGSGMSVRLEGSNALVGFDVVAEDQIYPFSPGGFIRSAGLHGDPYKFYCYCCLRAVRGLGSCEGFAVYPDATSQSSSKFN